MDPQDQRMQCLKMAVELGGNTDTVMSAAQRMLEFVTGDFQPASQTSTTSTVPVAATVPAVDAATPEPEVPTVIAAEPEAHEAVVVDPISACGTALVMPEGGNLADAIPSPDAAPTAVEATSLPEPSSDEAAAAPGEAAAAADAPVEPVAGRCTASCAEARRGA